MRRSIIVACTLFVPTFIGSSRGASAQRVGNPHGSAGECTYSACALNIVPRWNGLVVVRGSSGPQLANLNFFWPRDVSSALGGPSEHTPGADSAAAHARGAVRLRRIGAVLTDAGLVAGAIGVIGAMRAGRIRRADGVMLGTGGAALGVGVPFQFAADGALGRAVWWHNRRYAP